MRFVSIFADCGSLFIRRTLRYILLEVVGIASHVAVTPPRWPLIAKSVGGGDDEGEIILQLNTCICLTIAERIQIGLDAKNYDGLGAPIKNRREGGGRQ